MKRLIFIAVGIIMIVLVATQSQVKAGNATKTSGIQFQSGSWTQVLALAKKENKPIFLDVSASWCGYCKRMKSTVFTDADVAKYYNSTFINVSVDPEQGEGIQLAKRYEVTGYPTYIFINPDGSVATQSGGYQDKEEFLNTGKNATKK
ncbi:MAG: thioredoxin family protein [Paludibacter sp.]|nr:thioredoxin family protein [Paludibacter sp.]